LEASTLSIPTPEQLAHQAWLADAQHDPIPLLVFQLIGNVFSPAIAAMSTLMILFAMAVVIVLERVGGLRRAMAM
jgi:putative spermidine/putrescine transport system permease protein